MSFLIYKIQCSLKCLDEFPNDLYTDIIIQLQLVQNHFEFNAVIQKTVLDIFIEIMQRFYKYESLPNYLIDIVQQVSSSVSDSHKMNFYYPVFRKSYHIFNLHVLRLSSSNTSATICDYIVKNLITPLKSNVETIETLLNIILITFFYDTEFLNDIVEQFECDSLEIDIVKVFTKEELECLKNKLKDNKQIKMFTEHLILSQTYYPESTMKSYAIQSQLKLCNLNLAALISKSKILPGDIRNSMAMCIKRLVEDKSSNVDENIVIYLDYLTDAIQPWCDDSLRLTASKILNNCSGSFILALKNKNVNVIVRFMNLILCLLMDDDSDVRDSASKIVLKICKIDGGEQVIESISSTYAQQLLIEKVFQMSLKFSCSKDLITMIFHDIIKLQNNENFSSNERFEVFDKNEVNVFAEPRKVVMNCKEIYFKYFNKAI